MLYHILKIQGDFRQVELQEGTRKGKDRPVNTRDSKNKPPKEN